ncbi:hypothetical protein [Lysinibacter sp. HNR]|uniref:hypothetical protein n=1 Tax=Lysinibacter sp. HNR TaxID=3031408 RepID=UPI002435C527|nr:hypothetical protein [Lysinibacter sp. HNR]WGD38431.1 hypothetical protein FrondiHNR_05850 [Lysinibacter sp. HNR]
MSRPRRSSRRSWRHSSSAEEEIDLSYLTQGWRRTEIRGGFEWNVQPVSSSRALKEYRCPRCEKTIDIGTEHVVVWRADGVLGDSADLAARRHWHNHCWNTGR